MTGFSLDDRILVFIADTLPGHMCKGTVEGEYMKSALRLHDLQDEFDSAVAGLTWHGEWAESDIWLILDVMIVNDTIRLVKVASRDLRSVGWTDQTYRLKLLEE